MSKDKICPICKKDNGCRSGDADCWCHTMEVPKGLLDSIGLEERGEACICKSCIEKYKAKNNLG